VEEGDVRGCSCEEDRRGAPAFTGAGSGAEKRENAALFVGCHSGAMAIRRIGHHRIRDLEKALNNRTEKRVNAQNKG